MNNRSIPFRLLMLSLLMLGASALSAQVRTIKFDELKGLQQKEKRLVMVLVGTEWCKYCHAMKHSILRNPKIKTTLANNFYTVFLNAEEPDNIIFADQVFKYKPNGVNTGVHQLAEELATIQGQVSYPSLIFLNHKNDIVYQNSGYLEPAKLAVLLQRIQNIE